MTCDGDSGRSGSAYGVLLMLMFLGGQAESSRLYRKVAECITQPEDRSIEQSFKPCYYVDR